MTSTPRFQVSQLLRSRGAFVGLLAVSGLSVASSLAGFVFQIILAARFGTSAVIDSYLFAISAPTFIAGLGAAALSYTIVPLLVRTETLPSARTALLRRLVIRIGAVAVAFGLLGFPAMVVQPLLLPPGADLKQVSVLPAMIALGWMIGGTQFFAALFVIELNAARRPIMAALLTLIPNLGAISFVILAPRSILAAPGGVLFGSLAAMAIGTALTWRSFRFAERAEYGRPPPGEVVFGRVAWTLLAMSCFSAYAIIDAFWAPRASGGTLASLGYAQRLVTGIGGLILAGPSAILTPRFAERLREDGAPAFLADVKRVVLVVGAFGSVMAIILALTSDPLIAVAFGRGAFDVDDVARVSMVVRFMLPGFVAMLAAVVLTRAIYCVAGVERTMAMVGLGWSAVYFVTCGALLPLGVIGFGISYSVAWLAYALVATLILHRYARSSS